LKWKEVKERWNWKWKGKKKEMEVEKEREKIELEVNLFKELEKVKGLDLNGYWEMKRNVQNWVQFEGVNQNSVFNEFFMSQFIRDKLLLQQENGTKS